MTVQAIIYSIATGRVRRVVDPQLKPVASTIAFLAQIGVKTGEAAMIFTKSATLANNNAAAWQAAVNAKTGKNVVFPPDATCTDWYCGVDTNNVIQWWGLADPACGDAVPGLTLVNAPFGADSSWTYDGTKFTAPVITPTPPKIVTQ